MGRGLPTDEGYAVLFESWTVEAGNGVRRHVDRRLGGGEKVGYELAGCGSLRQAKVTVAEGVDDRVGARRRSDHRQRVGCRRAMPHPLLRIALVQVGQVASSELEQHRAALEVRWCVD